MEQYARGALIGELDDINPTGFTKLRDALELGPETKEGQLRSLQKFVMKDCGGVFTCDGDGCTALHWAARYEHAADLVRWLIVEKGASPDGLTKEQVLKKERGERNDEFYNEGVPTPLHEAARYDHHVIAKILLCPAEGNDRLQGANPNTPDRDGTRPLHICAVWNNVRTARCLLEHRANPAAPNKDGKTPIEWAASFQELSELMLEHTSRR